MNKKISPTEIGNVFDDFPHATDEGARQRFIGNVGVVGHAKDVVLRVGGGIGEFLW